MTVWVFDCYFNGKVWGLLDHCLCCYWLIGLGFCACFDLFCVFMVGEYWRLCLVLYGVV